MLFNKLIFLSSPLKRVGGKIFYIDNVVTGDAYTFYDQQGEVIPNVQVGDEPYYYTVETRGFRDKYYVFNNELGSGTWTYKQSGSWVSTLLGTGSTIGTGKTNTETVMAADSGKYVTALTGGDTIWAVVNRLRVNMVGGCTDWFVPSKDEANILNSAVDRYSNKLVTWFGNRDMWSSSEENYSEAWCWYSTSQNWYNSGKRWQHSVFGIRSF